MLAKETPEGGIGPFFSFPPLADLTIVFICWHSVVWDMQVDDLEEKLTPGNDRLWALLML